MKACITPSVFAVFTVFFMAAAANAQLTPGITLNFDAASDTPANATWSPDGTGSSAAEVFTFSNGNQSPIAVSDASTAGVTSAYAFPAGIATGSDTWDDNFNDAQDASFEIWFKPANSEGKHVLFELGGNTQGTLIEQNGKNIVFNTQDDITNRMVAAINPGDISDRHHQLVGTIDFTGGGAATINLYVDGELAATDSVASAYDAWGGNNASGLGIFSSAVPGGQDLQNSFTNFDGEISQFRFYENKALSASEVKANYDHVASASPASLTAAPSFENLQLSWDADAPGNDSTNLWQPNFAEAAPINWTLGGTNAPELVEVDSPGTIIDSAYRFDGTSTATATADWPNDTSNGLIEMWVKPTDLSGQETLLELGGTTDGSTFVLDGNQLQLVAKDDTAIATAEVGLSDALSSDFIQIAGYFDINNEIVRLYVNGEEVADSGVVSGLADFAGTDENGLGSVGNGHGGDLAGFGGFEGDFASLRFYTADLTQEEAAALVQGNYLAMLAAEVPEPTSIAIWALLALGLAGFGYQRFRSTPSSALP